MSRMGRNLPGILKLGPYKIDRDQWLLLRGAGITPLAPKAFDLLLLLAESGAGYLRRKPRKVKFMRRAGRSAESA